MLNFTRQIIFQPNWQLVDLYCFDVHWSSLSMFGSSDPRYIILSQLWFMSFFSSYITFHVLRLPKTTAVLWFTKKHLIRCSRCGRWWQGYIHGRWTKSQQRSLSHLSGEGFFDRFVETKTNGCVFLKRNYTWVFPKLRLPQNGWFIIDKYRKPTTIFWKHPYIMDHVKKLNRCFLCG